MKFNQLSRNTSKILGPDRWPKVIFMVWPKEIARQASEISSIQAGLMKISKRFLSRLVQTINNILSVNSLLA